MDTGSVSDVGHLFIYLFIIKIVHEVHKTMYNYPVDK